MANGDTIFIFSGTDFIGDVNAVFTAGDLPADLVSHNDAFVQAFVDGADEHVCLSRWMSMPQQYDGGSLSAFINGYNSVASNEVRLQIFLQSYIPDDADDLTGDTSADWSSENVTEHTMLANAGRPQEWEETLANLGGLTTASRLFRMALRRDSNDAGDDNTGIFYVATVELRETS